MNFHEKMCFHCNIATPQFDTLDVLDQIMYKL
jgi:hypothetical protein